MILFDSFIPHCPLSYIFSLVSAEKRQSTNVFITFAMWNTVYVVYMHYSYNIRILICLIVRSFYQ